MINLICPGGIKNVPIDIGLDMNQLVYFYAGEVTLIYL